MGLGKDFDNAMKTVADAVGNAIGRVGQWIGEKLGVNSTVSLRFEIVVAAHKNGGNIELQYIPVPAGTIAQLVLPAVGPYDPAVYQAIIGADGIATFPNVPTEPRPLYYARLRRIGRLRTGTVDIEPPEEWDTFHKNFYHTKVDAEDGTVEGEFTLHELVNKTVTFRVYGFPIHATLTYTFKESDPTFRCDASPYAGHQNPIREKVQNVPVPAGIKTILRTCVPLPGNLDFLLQGRTDRHGRWDAVMYVTPALLPPFPVDVVIHAMMNLLDDNLKLGPINIHAGFPPPLPDRSLAPEIYSAPVLQILSDSRTVTFTSHSQSPLALGTLEDRFEFEIREDSRCNPAPLSGLPNPGLASVFALQSMADVHSWFRELSMDRSGKDWHRFEGFQVEVFLAATPGGLPTSTSWPQSLTLLPTIFYESAHLDCHSVILHEFFHQIEYKLGVYLQDSELLNEFYHHSSKFTCHAVAMNEGWAEFVEMVFGRDMVSAVPSFEPETGGTQDLWSHHGAGEEIEGCVANALWEIYCFNPTISIDSISSPSAIDPVTVRGHAYNDGNHDGSEDTDPQNGEFRLENVPLQLVWPPYANGVLTTDANGEFSFTCRATSIPYVEFAFKNYRFNPVAAVDPADNNRGFAFDCKQLPAVLDPNEIPLSHVKVQYELGGVGLRTSETDDHGCYSRPAGAVADSDRIWKSNTGEYPFPHVVPAALTGTANLDTSQANLWHIRSRIISDAPSHEPEEYSHGLFRAIFYDCWPRQPMGDAEDYRNMYVKMLENAWTIDKDMGRFIQRIFWNNNMLMPQVIVTEYMGTFTASLLDVLGNPIKLQLPARIHSLSSDPNQRDLLITDLPTDINGEIRSSITLPDNSRVTGVTINVRALIPRADAAGTDVWLWGWIESSI